MSVVYLDLHLNFYILVLWVHVLTLLLILESFL